MLLLTILEWNLKLWPVPGILKDPGVDSHQFWELASELSIWLTSIISRISNAVRYMIFSISIRQHSLQRSSLFTLPRPSVSPPALPKHWNRLHTRSRIGILATYRPRLRSQRREVLLHIPKRYAREPRCEEEVVVYAGEEDDEGTLYWVSSSLSTYMALMVVF